MIVYYINIAVFAGLAILFANIDYFLELGQFHGLVFQLWTLYAAIILGMINLGLFFWRKQKAYAISAIGYLFVITIIILTATIIGNN